MIIVLTVLPLNTYLQIVTQMVATVYVIAYIARDHPYESSTINYQELVNEFLVLLASYPLLIFTSWVSDIERRKEAGWFLVACIVLTILFNISIVIVQIIKKIY